MAWLGDDRCRVDGVVPPRRATHLGVGWLALAVATIVLAGLAIATAARASSGAPIKIASRGSDPDLVVDSHGTAHIVWSITAPGPEYFGMTEYCQIPAGGTTCTHRQSFSEFDFGVSRVLLGPRTDEVVLLDTDGAFIFAWVSVDGGRTFSSGPNGSAGVIAGLFNGTSGSAAVPDEQPAFGPGDARASWMDPSGNFENFPVNEGLPVTSQEQPATDQSTQLFTDCGPVPRNSIALLNGITPVAECDNPYTGVIYYRVATGHGNLDDATTGSWGSLAQIAGQGRNGLAGLQGAWLAGGPSGVYLLYNARDGAADVSRLVNGRFARPVVLDAAQTFVEGLTENRAGALFAVITNNHGGVAGKTQRVLTSPDGVNWTDVSLDLRGVDAGTAPEAHVSGCANAAGRNKTGSGFVVFGPLGGGPIWAESIGNSRCGSYQPVICTAPRNTCKKVSPTIHGTVSVGPTSGKLHVLLTAGTSALHRVVVIAPGGFDFSTKPSDVRKGLLVLGRGKRLAKHIVAVTRSTLTLVLSTGQSGLDVSISNPLLQVSQAVRNQVKQHRRFHVIFRFNLTDVAGIATRTALLFFFPPPPHG